MRNQRRIKKSPMTAEITTRPDVKLSTAITPDVTNSLNAQTIMGVGEKRSYKLSYFDIRGRAEVSRMLFALAEVKFTDERVSYADWPTRKSKTPFGKLPVLEVSGGGLKTPFIIHQSHAIERYLAREFGLGGRTSFELAKVDMIMNTIVDVLKPIADIFHEQNESKKAKVLEEFTQTTLPQFLDYLTTNLQDQWFLDDVSLADASVYVALDNVSMFVPDVLESKKYWKMRDWHSRFEQLSQISEWLATRPVTAY